MRKTLFASGVKGDRLYALQSIRRIEIYGQIYHSPKLRSTLPVDVMSVTLESDLI